MSAEGSLPPALSLRQVLDRIGPTPAPIWVGKEYSINDLRRDLTAIINPPKRYRPLPFGMNLPW